MSYSVPSFNPSPQATKAFMETFRDPYEHLKIHKHLHNGIPHVGDKLFTSGYVIRHQFGPDGNLLGGMPEINTRF